MNRLKFLLKKANAFLMEKNVLVVRRDNPLNHGYKSPSYYEACSFERVYLMGVIPLNRGKLVF